MILLGYYLGKLIPGIESKVEYVIAVIIFLSILPMIIKYLRHRMSRKGESPASGGPHPGS
jgi:membrane-associated protein